jgi:bifunctional enzyme CysN/CysC
MWVQDVYKFTKNGDNRRIIAGMVESGTITVGDQVTFYPSGKNCVVKSIEVFNGAPPVSVGPGWALGFTTEEQIYVKRGECAGITNEPHPNIGTIILAHIFWLGQIPFQKTKSYWLKIGTKKIKMNLVEIRFNLDASNLEHNTKNQVDRNEVAEVVLKFDQPIAFDLPHEITQTSRFVIVDEFEIAGGGIIMKAIADEVPRIEETINGRIAKWERSSIDVQQRFDKYGQKPVMILIIGDDENKKDIAKIVEKQLFMDGKFVYYLGIDTGRDSFGANNEISSIYNAETRIQQLTEIASILLDTGLILITTASGVTSEHLEILKTTLSPEKIRTIWVGSEIITDIDVDMQFAINDDMDEVMREIKQLVLM